MADAGGCAVRLWKQAQKHTENAGAVSTVQKGMLGQDVRGILRGRRGRGGVLHRRLVPLES